MSLLESTKHVKFMIFLLASFIVVFAFGFEIGSYDKLEQVDSIIVNEINSYSLDNTHERSEALHISNLIWDKWHV